MLNLSAHHGKTRGSTATALTKEQLKPNPAAHTLAFIAKEYVEVDDDACSACILHGVISLLTSTRQPKISLFAWVDSFTMLNANAKIWGNCQTNQ
jgi:hypothetical protein